MSAHIEVAGLPEPVGRMLVQLSGGPEPNLYGVRAFYGLRSAETKVGPRMQVKIQFLGELVWINVRPEDILSGKPTE